MPAHCACIALDLVWMTLPLCACACACITYACLCKINMLWHDYDRNLGVLMSPLTAQYSVLSPTVFQPSASWNPHKTLVFIYCFGIPSCFFSIQIREGHCGTIHFKSTSKTCWRNSRDDSHHSTCFWVYRLFWNELTSCPPAWTIGRPLWGEVALACPSGRTSCKLLPWPRLTILPFQLGRTEWIHNALSWCHGSTCQSAIQILAFSEETELYSWQSRLAAPKAWRSVMRFAHCMLMTSTPNTF